MKVRRSRLLLPAALLLAGISVLYAGAAGASYGNGQGGYLVFNSSSLGGTSSAGISVNNLGLMTGYSNLEGDETRHATAWLFGHTFDLGTLGGANSAVLWPVKNDNGLVVGVAETDEVDPLDEDWSCSAFFPGEPTENTCVGFVWKNGVMEALPTLGGNNGFAAGANNRGQVVGWVENEFHDPTCIEPQVLQFRGVIWDTKRDEMQELQPLEGDTVSTGNAINERGQVVGISGICDVAVGRFSARHAVIWNDGEPTDIGNLGGVAWHTPMAINDRGEVVGFGNHSAEDEGAFNAHAFYWNEEDGIVDLGTLPGDAISQALGINNRGQIVGQSCSEGFATCRAFIWQDGVMLDLNTLAGPDYDDHLYFANDINDFGMIAGQAVDADSGESVAFSAIPRSGHGHGPFDIDAASTATSAGMLLPEQARQVLIQRLGLAGVEDIGR